MLEQQQSSRGGVLIINVMESLGMTDENDRGCHDEMDLYLSALNDRPMKDRMRALMHNHRTFYMKAGVKLSMCTLQVWVII